MKPIKASTKIRAEDKLREVESALKEAVGEAARNRSLEIESRREKRVGKLQDAVGRREKAIGK